MTTLYAPAERLDELGIRRQYSCFAENALVKEMMDAIKVLIVVFLRDISDSQRRIALERIFSHDILNISGIS